MARTVSAPFSNHKVSLCVILAILSISTSTTAQEGCKVKLKQECDSGALTCYVGLPIAPYVIAGKSLYGKDFACNDYEKQGLDGIVPKLMKKIWKQHGGHCYILSPESCTFDELVDWIDTKHNRSLIGLGAFLELPGYLSNDDHMQWKDRSVSWSASIVDSVLVVVGRTTVNKKEEFILLPKPFDTRVWIFVLITLALILLACFLLRYSDPSTKSERDTVGNGETSVDGVEGRNGRRKDFFIDRILEPFTDSLDFIFDRMVNINPTSNRAGDESSRSLQVSQSQLGVEATEISHENENGTPARSSGPSIHSLMRTILACTISLFLVVLLIFYQAALTNFIFKQDQKLPNRIVSLNDNELKNFTVLRNSPLADAWLELQRENTRGFEAWSTCTNMEKCFDTVLNSEGKFLITQSDVARYKIRNENLCSKLALFETEQDLFHYNAGLMYGENVQESLKMDIDVNLLENRVRGDLRKISEEFIGEDETPCPIVSDKISWRVYLIPTIVIVFFNVVVIFIQVGLFWQGRKLTR